MYLRLKNAGMLIVLILMLAACSPSVPEVTPAPTETPGPTVTPTREPTPTPDIQVYVNMDLPEGDPLRGRNASLRYSCRPCHFVEDYENFALPFTATDELPSILQRGELRINDPNYTGNATTNMEYFFESVYLPTAYIVPGDFPEPMPQTFHYRLTDPQEIADLLAWIVALDDPNFTGK